MLRSRFFFTAVLAVAAIFSVECLFEKDILTFLEEFRQRMCHPIPKLGLPPLDPLQIQNKAIALDSRYFVDFTASIKNFNMNGLSDFKINELILEKPLVRSIVNITLPKTWLKTLYTAKGSIGYVINLVGDDEAEASIDEFTLSFAWQLKLSTKLGIKSSRIEMHVGNLSVDFNDLIEEKRINNFVHDVINVLGIELLDDLWSSKNNSVTASVENSINNFIGQYSLGEIINIIGGEGGNDIFEGVEPDCKQKYNIAKLNKNY